MMRRRLKKLTFAAIAVFTILGCTKAPAAIVTTIYEFVPDQSTVTIYGPPAPPYICYIEGQFQLTVDYDAGTALFDWVVTSDIWGDSVGDIFYMTELEGTVVSDIQIDFFSESADPAFPYRDILLEFIITNGSAHLISGTFYPRYEVDSPFYALDAIAVPEPVTIFMLAFGGLIVRKRFFQQ